MTLWEFPLEFSDGTALSQTALAEGDDEASAAVSAAAEVALHERLVLKRPGLPVPPEVEGRWREVSGEPPFPAIAPSTGRLGLYARGLPDPSRVSPPAGTRRGSWGFRGR